MAPTVPVSPQRGSSSARGARRSLPRPRKRARSVSQKSSGCGRLRSDLQHEELGAVLARDGGREAQGPLAGRGAVDGHDDPPVPEADGRRRAPLGGAHDHDRKRSVRQDFLDRAAQGEPARLAPAVGAEDHQVGAADPGEAHDVVGGLAGHHRRGGLHPGGPETVGHPPEVRLRLRSPQAPVDAARHRVRDGVGFDHAQQEELRAQARGERRRVRQGGLGQAGAVEGDQDALDHGGSSAAAESTSPRTGHGRNAVRPLRPIASARSKRSRSDSGGKSGGRLTVLEMAPST